MVTEDMGARKLVAVKMALVLIVVSSCVLGCVCQAGCGPGAILGNFLFSVIVLFSEKKSILGNFLFLVIVLFWEN